MTLGLGLLTLATRFSSAESPASRVGWLLALAAGVELLHALSALDCGGARADNWCGVHGRLTWGEFASSNSLRVSGLDAQTLVEWVVPMTPTPSRG